VAGRRWRPASGSVYGWARYRSSDATGDPPRRRHAIAQLLAKVRGISDVGGTIEHHAGKGWDARTIETEVLGARDLTGILSRGDHAKRNIVESVMAGIVPPDGAAGPTPGPSKQ